MSDAAQVTHASREPQQGRSRASYERMLAAARELLIQRGNDEFALTDVAKLGKVSIGSIYCRFDSKDALLAAVQHQALAGIDAEQLSIISEARESATDLRDLVMRLVEGLAESLKAHAPILRPFMLRAQIDSGTSDQGKASYGLIAEAVHAALLSYREEVRHPEPERAAASAFRIMYAAIARYLGFGAVAETAGEGDWADLKTDLGHMCAAFLTTSPPA